MFRVTIEVAAAVVATDLVAATVDMAVVAVVVDMAAEAVEVDTEGDHHREVVVAIEAAVEGK